MKTRLGALVMSGVMSMSVASPAAARPQAASHWPQGAGAVTEVYANWILNCQAREERPACVIAQEQAWADGALHLLVNFRGTPEAGMTGAFLFPPNLNPAAGLTLWIDGAPLRPTALPFQTCEAEGCVGRLELSQSEIGILRTSQTLTVRSSFLDGSDAVFSIPLAGLAHSIARAELFQ